MQVQVGVDLRRDVCWFIHSVRGSPSLALSSKDFSLILSHSYGSVCVSLAKRPVFLSVEDHVRLCSAAHRGCPREGETG